MGCYNRLWYHIRVLHNPSLQIRLVRWRVSLYINYFNALSSTNVGFGIFPMHPLTPRHSLWTWCVDINGGRLMVQSISYDIILYFDITHPYKIDLNRLVRRRLPPLMRICASHILSDVWLLTHTLTPRIGHLEREIK